MFNSPLLGGGNPVYYKTLDDAYSDYDLAFQLSLPNAPVTVILTVDASAVVTHLDATGLHSSSLLIINNSGAIIGHGGDGGNGGGWDDPETGWDGFAEDGEDGGDALALGCATRINQTIGKLFGGGGGGGGEGGGHEGASNRGGSGGGGGVSGGSGGFQGTGSATPPTPSNGQDGGIGPSGTPGTSDGGGTGGDFGEAGEAGTENFAASPPGAGGAAGKAVELNGNTLTFTGNSESTLRAADLIKGAIS